MAQHAVSSAEQNVPPDFETLTLESVFAKDEDTVRALVAFVPPDMTIGEAKEAMHRKEGCQDIFVTEHGDRGERVIGWLTNGIISRAIDE